MAEISGMGPRKRHCWDCLRRCLVCDSTEPSCRRCLSSGTPCPGYGATKPTRLRWLEPGKVASRSRKAGKASTRFPGRNEASQYALLQTQFESQSISRFAIKTDACNLAQSAQYFNTCIYQDLLPITHLGRNPYVYQISSTLLRHASRSPEYLQLGMLCMTLSHRVNRLRHRDSSALTERFYFYRGATIKSLQTKIYIEDYTSDALLAGVLTLLLVDIQFGASLDWQWHLNGIHKIVSLRGGFDALSEIESLEPLLLNYWFVAVTGNTTCPASKTSMTEFHLKHIDLLLRKYSSALSPFHLCPPQLFVQLIKINHLRHLAKTRENHVDILMQEAYSILEHTEMFDVEYWANSKPSSTAEWVLVGHVYQTAVSLYCTLALQSVSILPGSSALQEHRVIFSHRLQHLLGIGTASPEINRFMLWPMVVLGVHAAREAAMYGFVRSQLEDLSYRIGTYAPLTAKNILETFWASGETSWDACFDRPYAFTMQIAVDISKITATL